MKRLLVSVLVVILMCTMLPAGQLEFAYADDAEAAGTDAATGAAQTNAAAQSQTEQDNAAVGQTQKTVVKSKVVNRLKKSITVKGLVTSRNEYKTMHIQDSIRVTGAYGKTVELQQLKSKGRWKTVRRYYVKGKNNTKITLKYPSRSKTYSYWRVHIDGDSRTRDYNSPIITVVSRNVRSLNLNARSACIYCMDTGQVIYGKNMEKRLPMASTTKIMTAVVVMENMKMNKKVRISRRAARTPYRNLYMKRGDRYYVKDLFKAMMVSSSNDAARALAENTAGSSSKFVRKMNKKARKLGLTRTHFTDEVGFGSSSHYSTAKDLAELMTYAYKSKTFRNSINKKRYSFRNVRRNRYHRVVSSSYPMYSFSHNYLGGKTGTTGAARCCFVAVYRYGGRTYVCVNLGSRNNFHRWRDSKRLYKYIRNYGKWGTMASGGSDDDDEDIYYPELVYEEETDAGDDQTVDDVDGAGSGQDEVKVDSEDDQVTVPDSDGEEGEVMSIAG